MPPKLSLPEDWVPGFSQQRMAGWSSCLIPQEVGNSASSFCSPGGERQGSSPTCLFVELASGPACWSQCPLYLPGSRQQGQETELMLYSVSRALAQNNAVGHIDIQMVKKKKTFRPASEKGFQSIFFGGVRWNIFPTQKPKKSHVSGCFVVTSDQMNRLLGIPVTYCAFLESGE